MFILKGVTGGFFISVHSRRVTGFIVWAEEMGNAARLSRRDIITIRYSTTYINAMHMKNGSWVGQFEFSLIVSRLRKFKRTHYRKMGSGVVYGNAN